MMARLTARGRFWYDTMRRRQTALMRRKVPGPYTLGTSGYATVRAAPDRVAHRLVVQKRRAKYRKRVGYSHGHNARHGIAA